MRKIEVNYITKTLVTLAKQIWNTWRVEIAITITIFFIKIFSIVKIIAISKYLLSKISMSARIDNQDGDDDDSNSKNIGIVKCYLVS